MTAHETFTCANCGRTYDKARSDVDALAEAREDWGDVELAVVCDDCHREVMEWMRTQGH